MNELLQFVHTWPVGMIVGVADQCRWSHGIHNLLDQAAVLSLSFGLGSLWGRFFHCLYFERLYDGTFPSVVDAVVAAYLCQGKIAWQKHRLYIEWTAYFTKSKAASLWLFSLLCLPSDWRSRCSSALVLLCATGQPASWREGKGGGDKLCVPLLFDLFHSSPR